MSEHIRQAALRIISEYEARSALERLKTGMTFTQAKQIVWVIILICQKMRSNVLESTLEDRDIPDSVDEFILGDLCPRLFPEYSGKVGVLELALRMYENDTFTPGEFYNLLWLFNDDPVLSRCGDTNYWNVTIPEVSPMPKWIGGFDPE